jgi:hypothetical protein
MKTGRVRKKAQPTPQEEAQDKPTAPDKAAAPDKPAKKKRSKRSSRRKGSSGRSVKGSGRAPSPKSASPYWFFGIFGAVFVLFVIFVIVMARRGRASEWVEVSRTNGSWTTTAMVLGPQVKIEERWEVDCISDANATVRPGSCIARDADTYRDTIVDDYEEYAYDIYYEETWDKIYETRGTGFVVTMLGSDDWWEGNLHYTREEELDRSACEYTPYTIWVDDPQNSSQEIEVYLAECEVWDHIVVEERVYDQKLWCQCEMATLVEIGQQSEQGTGMNVDWPNPSVPAGGRVERAFKGQVIFLGDDYSYTTSTDDLSKYQDYLTVQYYIGLKDGEPVTVSKNPD